MCSRRRSATRRRSGSTRPGSSASGTDAEPPLELFAPRPAHSEPRTRLEDDLVVPAGSANQRLDQLDADDDRTMDAHEPRRVEPALELVHRLADDVAPVAHVQLRVRPARDD